MPKEELPPDPNAVENWERLPHNKPSKDALPPMTGGFNSVKWLLILFAAAIIIGLLLERWSAG